MRKSLLLSGFVSFAFVLVACSSGGNKAAPGKTANPDEDGGVTGDTDGSVAAGDGSTPAPGVATPCTITKGTAGVNVSGRLLLQAGPIDGEVLIDSTGKITCAAASCASTAGYAQATHVSCPGAIVSPGIVNAHDHTEYNTAAPIVDGMQRYEHRNDWRTGQNGLPKLKEPQTTTDVNMLAAAELRFAMGGVTSLIGSGGTKGLVRNLANYQDTTQLEGLTGKTVFFDTFPLGDSAGKEITTGCAYPAVRAAGTAFEDGNYAPHVAEGINAAAENEFTCTSPTLITAKTAMIHGVGLTAKDIGTVATVKASLVWSPRSNMDLYGNTASITVYKNAGVNIAMGTDWLASGSMNMLRELQCADSLNQKYFNKALSDEDLWNAATHNGAIAAGFVGQIGDLAVGAQGDVVVFDGASGADYRAVIAAGVEDIRLVLRGGKVLYGDLPIATGLNSACETLSVCDQMKGVCIDTPSVTLASVLTAVQASYPLYFCKGTTPTAEPTCVPYRDTYPNGTSATDHDGDGVADATDDCPDVFNPARPLDGTTQADEDADGAGDACDKAPLDPKTK